jgi:hypothetical protein
MPTDMTSSEVQDLIAQLPPDQQALVRAALSGDPQIVDGQFMRGYWYTVPPFAFAGSGTDSKTLTIQDEDFEVEFLMVTRTSPLVTVEVFDGGLGGYPWQSAPVNIDNWAGTAQLPFPFGLFTQLLPRKRTYSFRLVNSSGAANNVQIALFGYKRLPPPQQA